MLPIWGVSKGTLKLLRIESLRNIEAVVNRLLRINTEEMDDLAEYLFDNYA